MTPRQRVLFSQIQIAGLGVVILVMSALIDLPAVFYYIGIAIILFGLVRLIMLSRLVKNHPFEDSAQISEENEPLSPSDTSLWSLIEEEFKSEKEDE